MMLKTAKYSKTNPLCQKSSADEFPIFLVELDIYKCYMKIKINICLAMLLFEKKLIKCTYTTLG